MSDFVDAFFFVKTDDADFRSLGDVRPVGAHVQQQRRCVGAKFRLAKFTGRLQRGDLASGTEQLAMIVRGWIDEIAQQWLGEQLGDAR